MEGSNPTYHLDLSFNTNMIRFLNLQPLNIQSPTLFFQNILNVPPPRQTDMSSNPVFEAPLADISSNAVDRIDVSQNSVSIPWSERIRTPPAKGLIRLLIPPPPSESSEDCSESLSALWETDKSFSDWQDIIEHNEEAAAVFTANQRQRWLAWTVWQRLTQRIWRRRTQCNVDMIEMAPVADADAILITDTKHHIIYKFHRHDLFNTLMANITHSDEMLPNPRRPRNPWTNAPFNYGQIVGVCQALLQDYARRGRCPPALFSAFWAAQFDVRRFSFENAPLLSQHAIVTYFKDITDHNREVIAETIHTLLASAGILSVVPVHVRRWLRITPLTEGHRAWLNMARDYTLYMNLHVQVRPHWHSESIIYRDVRRLQDQHPVTDNAGPRLRALRDMRTLTGHDTALQDVLSVLFGANSNIAPPEGPFGNIFFGGRG